MKSTFLLTSAAALCLFTACNKPNAGSNPTTDATRTVVVNPEVRHSNARMGAAYSQPISLETANEMIGSYLKSVNYPYQDSAIRSLSFDADSLRAYLADSRIKTMKFVFAHQPAYLTSEKAGTYSGMKPGVLTLIAVGVDNNNTLIRNTSGGVYEHALPCPVSCDGNADGFLH
jgi:hypothetical protein